MRRCHGIERAHVVQSIGELDENDPHVLGHCQQHLAETLRLALLGRSVVELADFCQTVNEVGDLGAEVFFDVLDRRLGIFNGVVQQAGGDTDRVELEFGEDVGDFERVDQIRFARLANLAAVLAGREQVGAAQQVLIRAGMVLANFFDDALEANHCGSLPGGCTRGSLCLPLSATTASKESRSLKA